MSGVRIAARMYSRRSLTRVGTRGVAAMGASIGLSTDYKDYKSIRVICGFLCYRDRPPATLAMLQRRPVPRRHVGPGFTRITLNSLVNTKAIVASGCCEVGPQGTLFITVHREWLYAVTKS